MGVARQPDMLKPKPSVKQRVIATIGLLGVTGDSGRRQNSQGIWETHRVSDQQGMLDRQRLAGINNRRLARVGVGEGNRSLETG